MRKQWSRRKTVKVWGSGWQSYLCWIWPILQFDCSYLFPLHIRYTSICIVNGSSGPTQRSETSETRQHSNIDAVWNVGIHAGAVAAMAEPKMCVCIASGVRCCLHDSQGKGCGLTWNLFMLICWQRWRQVGRVLVGKHEKFCIRRDYHGTRLIWSVFFLSNKERGCFCSQYFYYYDYY